MIDSLQQAKNDIRQGWETPDGATCPCCNQKVKLYPRQVYSAPARALINLYLFQGGYHHIRDLKVDLGGSDFSKLKYWGLIEHAPRDIPILDDPKKRTSGYWAITDKGEDFVENKIRIPFYCYIYNDHKYNESEETKSIVEAIGDEFDYRELMGYLI